MRTLDCNISLPQRGWDAPPLNSLAWQWSCRKPERGWRHQPRQPYTLPWERERQGERGRVYWHFFNLILRRYIELKGPKMSKSFLVNWFPHARYHVETWESSLRFQGVESSEMRCLSWPYDTPEGRYDTCSKHIGHYANTDIIVYNCDLSRGHRSVNITT